MAKQKLVVASQNEHKVREIKTMLEGLPFEVVAVSELGDFPEVVEDGLTFQENAIKKAVETAKWTNCLCLADDSGLEVDFLEGKPGVYSARFAGEPRSDQRNNEKLLMLMKDVPYEKRGAQFRCVMALAFRTQGAKTFEGICRGIIGFQPRGISGFGYDPLFIVPEYDQTFAEIGEEKKNTISHRALAVNKVRKALENGWKG